MKLKRSRLCVFLFFFALISSQFVCGSSSLALKGSHILWNVGERDGSLAYLMQAHMGAKGVVKERMQLMKSYAASMKAINLELRDIASVNYILIIMEANKIVKSSKNIMELFPSGSVDEVSEASPKIWQKPKEFKKIVEDLKQAARGLAQATSTGELKLVKEQFRELGGACKKCHQEYRLKKKG